MALGLSVLGKDAAAIRENLKSAAWKMMLTVVIRDHTSATNVWITEKLDMGISQGGKPECREASCCERSSD